MSIPEINREIKRLQPIATELWQAVEEVKGEPLKKWLAVQEAIEDLKKERARLVDGLEII